MFEKIKQRVARAIVKNSGIGSSRELAEYLLGRDTHTETGIDVTPDTAMRLSTVYACVRVLSEDQAKLPLKLYKKSADGKTQTEVTNHWLAALLRRPNPWQTDYEFREMEAAHIELSGNFYGIKTIVRGEVREIIPIPPWRMKVEQQKDWSIKYTLLQPDGTEKEIPSFAIYHTRGLSLNGYLGLSPIAYQRETISFGIALRKFGNVVFKNGATFSGVLEHPNQMSDPAWERLKASFEESYAGVDNAHKVLLLEEGTKFTEAGMSNRDSQFLDSKKLSRSEIAGIYRVPLHMINDLERATFSNIEQQSREYVQNSLLGRVTRMEQRKGILLIPVTEPLMYFKYDLRGLLRGDFQTRMAGYAIGVQNGWLTRNEVRGYEEMNPGPPELDEFLTPSNLANADPNATTANTNENPAQSDTNARLEQSIRQLRDQLELIEDRNTNLRLLSRGSR